MVKEMAQTFATQAVVEVETPTNPLLSKVKKQPEATPLISEKNAADAIINDIEESIASIAELPNIDVIAVALNTSPPIERANQIIINEESNTGKKITTAYRVIEVNGQWYIIPLWMMKDEPSPIADSLNLNQKISKKDSLL
jgi:hypothetical protein